jgi:ribonuclease T1
MRMLRPVLLVLALLFVPAVAVPAPASASVYSSCSVSGCSAARTALTGWKQLGLPTSRTWYAWPYGQYNFAGGRFYNYDGQLPSATYYEYDVYPRARGAARDAYRIVVNRSTGATWYSPDHYEDFYRIA